MEQATLNQKSWYRALKVSFVLAFILGQGLGFFVTKTAIADAQALMILCNNGSEFVSPYSYLYSDVDRLAVNLKCNPDGKSGEVVKILSEDKRRELDGLVMKMEAQKMAKNEIQLFVNDFKDKNGYVPEKYTVEQITGGRELIKQSEGSYLVPSYSTYYSDKYSSIEKILYYLLSFFIISAIFWLISRTFFYVFAKENFFKFPLKKIR
jgi:hypothetical protein